jgi:3-ketoacyl-CoA synthase
MLCCLAPCSWRFPRSRIRDLCHGRFSNEDVAFQERMAYRTGLSDDTAVCPAIQSGNEANCGMEAARFEFGATCLTTVSELFAKTGIQPHQVNFVITNSSLFNPTPSLSAMIMNHFKMSGRTINYSLGGMGCSAGVIALDLARELLGQHPNSIALVVSHENITNNYYSGKDKSMLIPNVGASGWWPQCALHVAPCVVPDNMHSALLDSCSLSASYRQC